MSKFDEQAVREAAKKYVKLLHAKRQWHFNKPQRGPLPSALDEEGYMFFAGARWQFERLKALAENYRATLQRIVNEGIDTSTDGGMDLVRHALAQEDENGK